MFIVWFPRPSFSALPVGLTFGEVSTRADRLMQNVSGAPWTLSSALGVLSAGPTWFNPIGDEICRDVPGNSVWNASRMQTAPDQLSSGVSPFWSLLYTNSSHYLVNAVSMGTSLELAGPISPATPCGALMTKVVGNFTASPVLDSPAAAARAWSIEGSAYVRSNPNAFEFLETGGGQLGFWGSTAGAWIVGYQLCGLAGYMGSVTSQTDELKFQNTSGQYFSINSTGACTQSAYRVGFGNPTNTSGPGSTVLTSAPLSLGFANSSNATDGWGLTTGSTAVSVVNVSSGLAYSVSSLSCTLPNLSIASCGGPLHWYAVLTNPRGDWLDVYGNFTGALMWALPNVPFYTGDSLLIVHPGFSGGETFSVSIVAVSAAVQVTGSGTI